MDRAFNNELEMLRRKARALVEGPLGYTGTKVSVFVERQGKLYTLQSPEGWPIQPYDIDGVTVVPSDQHVPSDDVLKPTPRYGAGMMAKNLRHIFLGPGELKTLGQRNDGRLSQKARQPLVDAPSSLPQSATSEGERESLLPPPSLLLELKETTSFDTPETAESESPKSDAPLLPSRASSTESPSRSI
ncbi:unnamed protein product [Discula destructiva]